MSKHSKKYKRNLSDIESIYKDYDSRFKKGGGGFGKAIFIGGLFVIMAALAMGAGYFVFSGQRADGFKTEDVSLELKGNETVISGEEVFYVIRCNNNSNVDALNSEINFLYPEGFIFKTAEPEPLGAPGLKGKLLWNFDKLGEGEEKQIKIRGVMTGNIGDEKTLQVSLKYNPANTGAYFIKKTELSSAIEGKYLDLSLSGNGNFAEGKKNNLKIKYLNKSASPLENIKLIAYFPKGTSLFLNDKTAALSETDSEKTVKYEMEMPEIEGKSEKELDMDVIVNSDDYGASFRAEIGYTDKDGNFFLDKEETYNVIILKEKLDVSLVINGTGDKGALSLKDPLNGLLTLKNSGKTPLKNIEARVIIDDSDNLLDWETLALADGAKSDNKEIVWASENFEKLKNLDDGQSAEFEFSIKLKDGESDNIIEGAISSWAEVKTGNAEGGKPQKSNLVLLRLSGDLELKSELRYFNENGDTMGSGPIPPKVGEKTTYKVFWLLENNGINDVKNIKIEGSLADYALWQGKKSLDSGELYYDQTKDAVIWSVPNLPKNLSGAITGIFELSVRPKEEDAGKSLVLIKEIRLIAADIKTGAKIEKIYSFITTDDEAGGGDGMVGE